MGWLISLFILFLLAILPLGVSVQYDAQGFRACVIAGPLRILVFPLPKWLKKKKPAQPASEKQEKKKPDEKKAAEPKSEAPTAERPKRRGGSLTRFLPFVKLGLDFLGDFRRKLRLNHLELKWIMAGGDPCDLAVNYGRAWAALASLLPALERAFVIQKRKLEVECDFAAEDATIIARLDITITLGRLLSLVAVYGVKAFILYRNMKKNKKGGTAA